MPVRDLFADRVYVFTPLGDIIDLPTGATPLDFAYSIHSEIGHRCRGAKVNNKLVPLSYQLKTGERVDIQTTKTSHPSRDWLNPHKGYITTVRARSHILHWFKLNEPHEKVVQPQDVQHKQVAKKKAAKQPDVMKPKMSVSNYLTKVSRCCNPSSTDSIVGYITQKQGLSIHKEGCKNVQQLRKRNPERFLEIKRH
jgi:GTP pyrophosphokinase